jgi:hypothetical protein
MARPVAFEFLPLPDMTLQEISDAAPAIAAAFGFSAAMNFGDEPGADKAITAEEVRTLCTVLPDLVGRLYCIPTNLGPVFLQKRGGHVSFPKVVLKLGDNLDVVEVFQRVVEVLARAPGIVASYLFAQLYYGPDAPVFLDITKHGELIHLEIAAYQFPAEEIASLAGRIPAGCGHVFFDCLGSCRVLTSADAPVLFEPSPANGGLRLVLTSAPDARVYCLSSEAFVNEFCGGFDAIALKFLKYILLWHEPAPAQPAPAQPAPRA